MPRFYVLDNHMHRSREWLAWVILLGSFFACIMISITVPVGINLYLQRATKSLTLFTQTNQGTLVLNRGTPLRVNDARREVDTSVRMETNNLTDSGLLQLYEPEGLQLLARVQIHGNSSLQVEGATQPRFERSSAESQFNLTLKEGRIRLNVPPEDSAVPLNVNIETTHGLIAINTPGDYAIEAQRNDTQLSVLSGEATLVTPDKQLDLTSDQRGIINANFEPEGPFSTERNLIKNGDFSLELDEWYGFPWQIERTEEPFGEMLVTEVNGEPALRFRRNGIGNARGEVRQSMEQSLIDFSELRLLVSFRIWSQSLDVCGSLGSECPITIRLNYEDELGNAISWQQGIYARGDTSNELPPFCTTCSYPLNLSEHWKASREGELVIYESENLLARLQQESLRPIRINTLSLIAEGHTFEVDIVDIALIARE